MVRVPRGRKESDKAIGVKTFAQRLFVHWQVHHGAPVVTDLCRFAWPEQRFASPNTKLHGEWLAGTSELDRTRADLKGHAWHGGHLPGACAIKSGQTLPERGRGSLTTGPPKLRADVRFQIVWPAGRTDWAQWHRP
jgi:hypothetical protein